MTTTFRAPLRGASFRPAEAKALILSLGLGDTVMLEREPDNPHDPNAIKVLHNESGMHLAYVAADVAVDLAPLMDAGQSFRCTIIGQVSPKVPLSKIEALDDTGAPVSGA